MKNILNRIILIIAAGLILTGCEENAIPELTVPITGEMTKAKFFFHSDDAPPANFYFGNTKITAAGSTTAGDPQGSAYRAVYPSNAYAVIPSGKSMLVYSQQTISKSFPFFPVSIINKVCLH